MVKIQSISAMQSLLTVYSTAGYAIEGRHRSDIKESCTAIIVYI